MFDLKALHQFIRPVIGRAFRNKNTEQAFQRYNRELAIKAFPLVLSFLFSGWLVIWVMTLFFSHWISSQTRLMGIGGIACALVVIVKYLPKFLNTFSKYFSVITFVSCAALALLFSCLEYIYRAPNESGFLYSSLTALVYIQVIGCFAFVRPSLKSGLLLAAWIFFLTIFFLNKAYPGEYQSLIRVITYQSFAISMGFIIGNIIKSNDRRIFIKIIRLARIAEHRKILLSRVNMASKAKTDFLATISHEVRTPLHGIMSMMAFLNSKNLLSAPADKKIAEAIKISANRLLTTLNDILDFAQSEDGRIMQLIPSVFTIKEILFDCNSIFENTASLKGVDLLFHVDDESGSICFYADKNKITRVIINLISNAIKFTPAGGSVNVKAMVVMNNLDKINCVGIFEIIDTGAGISENNLRNIFQAFFQVNSGDSRTHQGNGLGLAICQQIVSAMNGEIHVKSVQQEGTVFRVSIPLSAANAKISQM